MTKWSALIGQFENWGGWSKPPLLKAVKGLYGQTRDAVIGRIKMTSSNLVYIYIYIYSGVKRFFL